MEIFGSRDSVIIKTLDLSPEPKGGGGAAGTASALASVFDRQGKPALAADALETYLRDVPNARNAAAIRQVIERLRRKAKG